MKNIKEISKEVITLLPMLLLSIKVDSVINVFILYINVPKIPFVYVCNVVVNFVFSYSKTFGGIN